MDIEAIMMRRSAMTLEELITERRARDDQMNTESQARLEAMERTTFLVFPEEMLSWWEDIEHQVIENSKNMKNAKRY
jgi:hypothetical protein